MPALVFTEQEILDAAIHEARAARDQIFTLMDLSKTPLAPGETVADRHHKIAKAGKRLALAYDAIDRTFSAHADAILRTMEKLVADQPEINKTEAN
jgi:hypothetical protein